MSKVIKYYLISIFSLLYAGPLESELGIHVGLNSTKNEDGNKFHNPMIGVSYQDNKYIVAPRVDLDYTKVRNDHASSLIKASLNGVYEYDINNRFIPYVLAGVGYEYVGGATDNVFENNFFVQGGGGLKFDLAQGLKVTTEGKVLQIVSSSNDEGNEFILTAGLTMPLQGLQEKPKPKPKMVRKPIILKPQPKVIPRVKVVHSNKNECPIKISAPDFDRDGIPNNIDQCPATPCNFTVDRYGCPIKTTLKVHFASGSHRIQSNSQSQINQFAHFLLRNKGSRVSITGHTDSIGSALSNLALSNRRAKAVMNALIHKGVSSSRLEAHGQGESMPIASNKTASGKAMNRRIEAELFYPKGVR